MKKWIPTRFISVLIIFTFMIIGGKLWTISGGDPRGEWVLVTEIVDGDTIYVGRGWRYTKVRLIGVDTPETVHPEKPVEFFGPEASEFAKTYLEGKKVHLEFDYTNQYDRYGRLLAYVFLSDNTFFNAELVKRGYARVIAPSPFRYYKEFRVYELEARTAGIGIWGEKSNTLQERYNDSRKIICHKRSKIYHLPGQASYDRIKEENRIYFNTQVEAINAGCRKAKR